MKTEAKEFMSALFPQIREDSRVILCAFEGDPNNATIRQWQPKPWQPGQELRWGPHWNLYTTISSFKCAQDGTWRRRGELFSAGHALMIDDVGTKVDPDLVVGLPPSAIVETSPMNFQWWYFLTEPEEDKERFDGVIRAFISGKLLGCDPGMAGVTRVGRLPGYLNGKGKYGGFQTRLHKLNDFSYSVDELLNAFGLRIAGRQIPLPRLATEEALERNRAFMAIYKFLDQRKMIKRSEPDMSGWTEISCPWCDGHTGGVDNGAAICEPSENNAWYGGFRCHHGSCISRGWRELTEWVAETAAEELERLNMEAHNGN